MSPLELSSLTWMLPVPRWHVTDARSKSWDEFAATRCAGHRFYFHGVRQRGERALPDLTRPSHHRALGDLQSGSRDSQRGRNTSLTLNIGVTPSPDRIFKCRVGHGFRKRPLRCFSWDAHPNHIRRTCTRAFPSVYPVM